MGSIRSRAFFQQNEEVEVHADTAGPADADSHQEDEYVIFIMRPKVFRFDSVSTEWKGRGAGEVRLLKHKESGKIRLVLRQNKALKICANHIITSDMCLLPNVGSDCSWAWKVPVDYAENPPRTEGFVMLFANPYDAHRFKAAFEDAKKNNA